MSPVASPDHAQRRSTPVDVAIISRDYNDAGGAEKFAAELASEEGLDQRYRFTVLTVQPGLVRPPKMAVPLDEIASRTCFQPWGLACAAARSLRGLKVDLIHSHELVLGADILTAGDPVWHWMTQLNRKALLRPKSWARLALENLVFRHCPPRVILPMSRMVERSIHRAYPHLRDRTEVLYPGIHLPESTPHSLPSLHPLRLLFVGSGFARKGLDRCLRLLAALRKTGMDVHLTVVGRGNSTAYERLAQQLEVRNCVTFAGYQPKGARAFYESHHALLLLSRYETFGMVALEAMAHGMPAMVSSATGVSELISHERDGWVIDWSEADLSKPVRALLSLTAPKTLDEMAAQARATAGQHTWARRHQQLAQIYERVLAAKSASAEPLANGLG